MPSSGFSSDLLGHTVLDAARERIGQLASLYDDVDTGDTCFGGVAMIRRGRRRIVFVPLVDATIGPASVTVRCGKDRARRAPSGRQLRTVRRGRSTGVLRPAGCVASRRNRYHI
jgi:hypothetical protein